ncbi:MAG TPA: DUF4258 domain-containing protein [bacterium]|nr:DUF4258 domain-containing protein [bacterium]
MKLADILDAIAKEHYRVTEHADDEAQNDRLLYEDIFESVLHGEIIEEYPKDKPCPSILIAGKNYREEPIHSVWGYNEENGYAILITVYRPDPKRWIENKKRRK